MENVSGKVAGETWREYSKKGKDWDLLEHYKPRGWRVE